MPSWQKMTVAVSRTWLERTSKMEMKTEGMPERDGKGKQSRGRRGELDLTMASKNNCKGERQ
jgi:hypothetical protein